MGIHTVKRIWRDMTFRKERYLMGRLASSHKPHKKIPHFASPLPSDPMCHCTQNMRYGGAALHCASPPMPIKRKGGAKEHLPRALPDRQVQVPDPCDATGKRSPLSHASLPGFWTGRTRSTTPRVSSWEGLQRSPASVGSPAWPVGQKGRQKEPRGRHAHPSMERWHPGEAR